MNEKQAEAMLKSLKRIENFLEAIDWKLWNFHEKYNKQDVNEETISDIESDEEKELADLIKEETSQPKQEAKKTIPGYPSIAKWG